MKKFFAILTIVAGLALAGRIVLSDVIEGRNNDNNGFPKAFQTNDNGQFLFATGTADIQYDTVEYVTCTMLTAAATDCSPAAESYEYSFQNAATETVYVREGGTAALYVGDMYLPVAGKDYWGMNVTVLSVYNPGAQATATILFRR